MLQVIDNSIKMTRGDSAYFEIDVYTPEGGIYELQDGDKLHFTVRTHPAKKSNSEPPLIEKTFYNNRIKFVPEDTDFIKYGRYFWDCTLVFANGDINTVCSGDITFTYEVV